MNRTDVINAFIRRNNFQTYCEIGVEAGINFHGVKCPLKVGVDPDPTSAATIHMTSDEFFEANPDVKFDVFWIDGLHHSDQVEKDIQNAIKCLNRGGVILCHDMLPTSKDIQEIPRGDRGIWTGDCWKAFVRLRLTTNLFMFTVDTDWGCGVIIPDYSQEKLVINVDLNYENFEVNKKEWMNVMSLANFKTFLTV